jgi:alkylhydroperoxidase/carboxymuconolactone decarboxylase family protein YurZ
VDAGLRRYDVIVGEVHDMSELDERRRKLKQDFTEARGYWSPIWDDLLRLDPDFFAAYLDFSAAPWRHGSLPPKIKELMYIAVDASTTHLYEPGLRIHIRNALQHGATKEEIMEVYQLTSVLGIHTMTMGVPALLDEMAKAGKPFEEMPLTARQEQLKREFTTNRGYWSPLWDGLLRLAPDYFAAYVELSSVPWKHGTLEPKVKEFVYIAIDAATTHLYEPGIRIHVANALNHGATPGEILEVLELVSSIGVHTVTVGVPVLVEELARFEAEQKANRR